MTIIDIYSGFLGAGKTTLIKKMIQEAYCGQQLVLIENEFGEIGIDGGFLQEAGINITEMNSGCICCSLVGDFGKALEEVISKYHPDRVIIEPSGVGKLSDVVAAVEKVTGEEVCVGYKVAVADAGKVKVYMKNFGEFYNNQIETASTIILSRTDAIAQAKLDGAVELLRQHNQTATLVTTPWGELTGKQLLEAMEGTSSVEKDLEALEHQHHHHEHHHHEHHHHEEGHCCCGHDHEHHHEHHHHEEGHCCCGHDHEHHHEHHHHEEGYCCCGHDHEHHHHEHHHHEEGHCCCGHDHEHHHEHHHHEEGHCCCGHDHEHHHHEHHHHEDGHCCCGHDHEHHHADEVFTSWGRETTRKFSKAEIETALRQLDTGIFGMVLRAKGIVACTEGGWIHFDYVPEEADIRMGGAAVIGKLCVIGANLDEEAIGKLFGV